MYVALKVFFPVWADTLDSPLWKPNGCKDFLELISIQVPMPYKVSSIKTQLLYFLLVHYWICHSEFSHYSVLISLQGVYTTFSDIFCICILSSWSPRSLRMKTLRSFKTLWTPTQSHSVRYLNPWHILCQSIANENSLFNWKNISSKLQPHTLHEW
jgi:hypothetical protein